MPTFTTGFLLHDVSRIRKKIIDEKFKPLGVTRSQWWVLANIARYGNSGIAQTQLALRMNVGKVSLGRLIDRMDNLGYLERRDDSEDRRARIVFMTNKGEKLLHDMQGIADVVNKAIMKGINRKQNKLLDELLDIMKHNLLLMDQ